jgi:hypothetical protein
MTPNRKFSPSITNARQMPKWCLCSRKYHCICAFLFEASKISMLPTIQLRSDSAQYRMFLQSFRGPVPRAFDWLTVPLARPLKAAQTGESTSPDHR